MDDARLAEILQWIDSIVWHPKNKKVLIECVDEIARLRAVLAESEAEVARLRKLVTGDDDDDRTPIMPPRWQRAALLRFVSDDGLHG